MSVIRNQLQHLLVHGVFDGEAVDADDLIPDLQAEKIAIVIN